YWEGGVFNPIVDGEERDRAREKDACDVFVKMLEQFHKEGRDVDSKPRSGSYAPRVFSEHVMSGTVDKDHFKRAMDTLLQAGRIKVEEYGRPSKRRERLIFPVASRFEKPGTTENREEDREGEKPLGE